MNPPTPLTRGEDKRGIFSLVFPLLSEGLGGLETAPLAIPPYHEGLGGRGVALSIQVRKSYELYHKMLCLIPIYGGLGFLAKSFWKIRIKFGSGSGCRTYQLVHCSRGG